MSFGFSGSVTIDHTKCGSGNSTDFPMLFSTTHNDLRTVGNGGKVQNANGYDIAFFSDSGLTTALSFELVSYNAATGAVTMWVKIPTLLAASDTVSYIGVGDAGISTDQSSTATWNSAYKAVYHLKDGTTLSLADSTSNAANLTNHSATAATGKIDGGMHVTRASSQYAETSGNFTNATSTFTVEQWVKLDSLADYEGLSAQWDELGGVLREWAVACFSSGSVYFYISTDGTGITGVTLFSVNTGGTHLATGTWAHVVCRMDSSNGSTGQEILINNVSRATGAGHTVYNGGTPLSVGRAVAFGGAAAYADGALDEVRYSNSYRSTDWLTANYNSQNDPSSFYTLGTISATGTSVSVSGLSATAAVGAPTVQAEWTVSASGLSATGAVGSVSLIIGQQVPVSGLEAAAAVGSTSETLSPTISVSGLAATAAVGDARPEQNITVSPSGLAATGAVGAAYAILAASAHFDGTGNNYYKATAPAEATYPFSLLIHVQSASFITFGNVMNIFSCERTGIAATNGFGADIYKKCPRIYAGDGTNTRIGISDIAALSIPYAGAWSFEFVSATDRRAYCNGVRVDLLAPDNTSCTPDLSAGSPEIRFGFRGTTASQPMKGNMQHAVMCSTAPLSAGDRTIHMTPYANYALIAGAAHWWPLQQNGLDVIGSANLTMVGTVTFDTGDILAISQGIAAPTAAQYCEQIFKQSTLPTGTCTVTALGSPPLVPTSSNYASAERLDGTYTGTDTTVGSPFTFRVIHYIPTTKATPRQAVLLNGGHQTSAEAATYHIDTVIDAYLDAGIDVYWGFLPGYDAQNPGDVAAAHDFMITRLSGSVNPLEKFLIPFVMVVNTIAGTFGNSIWQAGLSGGAWLVVRQMALDARIKIGVAVRGAIADRYYTASGQDFEQWAEPNYWKQEHIFEAAVRRNRRLVLIHAPNDSSVAAKTKSGDHGSYLDATNYDADILAPIRLVYPKADITFHEDANDGSHFFSNDSIAQSLTAFSTALTPLTAGKRGMMASVGGMMTR